MLSKSMIKMARKAVIESLILKQAWRISINRTYVSLFHSHLNNRTPILSSRYEYRIIRNIRDFCSGRRIDDQINRSHDENQSSSLVADNMQEPLAEADHKINSGTRKTKGNIQQTTNMVFGSTVIDGSTGEWLTLNELNTYPSVRRFTAIGIGGDDFVRSMVVAVESIIQHPVPQDHVKQRVSSRGKYVSVNIGPVRVFSREQVEAVYKAMRSDERMKFFL